MMGDVRLLKADPGKAYVSDMLWLPKAKIAEQAIKQALEFWDVEKGTAVLCKLWDETRDHLICPREFIKPEKYPQFPFPFIDLSPKKFAKTNIWVKNDPRDEDQRKALSAFSTAQSGILNLACGKGKTYLALKRAEQLGCPVLVVVHNSYLLNQWLLEAIPEHVELPPGEKVGVIQGSTFDWQHPITVAMIHSLASRAAEGKIPSAFRRHFGAVIYDEVQHLSAPVFITTAPIITGYRFGLTATEKRLDGTDFIYKYHLGDVFYTDLVQSLIPRIYFQQTPVWVDLKAPEVRDVRGEVNISRLRSFIGGQHDESNNFRAKCIREALDQGRKILCVSHSKDQLKVLHELFPGSGLVIQETDPEERSSIVRRSQVTFAIASLGFEGLDDKALDTVFVLLPFSSPNDIQQVMGRIQREKEGKNHPVLIIFDDVKVKPFHALCNKMRAALKEWDKHVAGMPPLTYTTLQAP
jgi:superfamily II DNA or RNA helicase